MPPPASTPPAANSNCSGESGTLNPIINGTPFIRTTNLTADQQFQAGLSCAGVAATPGAALPALCPAAQLTSSLLSIPTLNTQDNDKAPGRIAPRNLFDLSIGDDKLFGSDKHHASLRVTAVNLTNRVALYNFLSTFSGTHYVSPRTLTAELGFHF